MPLTKEQLLIPRVMCVGGKEGEANDTSGKWITGAVLYLTNGGVYSENSDGMKKVRHFIDKEYAHKFPHLFRPMPWWEGRKLEDMPRYLKHNKNGRVIKVSKYLNNPFAIQSTDLKYGATDFVEAWDPATEQEYLEYQKQKEG